MADAVSPSTKVPLGAAGVVFATVLGVGWKLSESLTTIDQRLKRVEEATSHDKSADMQREIDVLTARILGIDKMVDQINVNGTAGMRSSEAAIELKVQKIELALEAIVRDRIPASEFDRWVELNRASGATLIPRTRQ